MGTLFSAFAIGNSALHAAQVQIDVTAHNIANVNTPGYSRQRAELTTQFPHVFPFGEIGRGVQVQNVSRARDEFLDRVYRQQVEGLGFAELQAGFYGRIENIFNEPGPGGFGEVINEFFQALDDFSNNVESFAVREAVLTHAEAVSVAFNQAANRFDTLITDANGQVENLVDEINSLGERIAQLNRRIRQNEISGRTANDLRDQRGALLDELSKLARIHYRETAAGQITVFLGDDLFVEADRVELLETVANPALSPDRNDLLEVRFAESGALANLRGGSLAGALDLRDRVIPEFAARVDAMAAAIISEINRVHSQGNGLQGHTGPLTSTNPVSGATAPLTTAGLPFEVVPGSFEVVVADPGGATSSFTVNINAGTTLEDVVNAIAAGHPGLTAAVADDQFIEIASAVPGQTFFFADDTSGALGALGINGVFTGHSAQTMAVNPDLLADSRLLSSGFSTDPADAGDNRAAIAMANVRNAHTLENGSSTIGGFYQATIARAGVEARANAQRLASDQLFIDDFERRRQEVSGVSLDEEITRLLQFQRGFEAAARIISVTDRMLETLVTLGQ